LHQIYFIFKNKNKKYFFYVWDRISPITLNKYIYKILKNINNTINYDLSKIMAKRKSPPDCVTTGFRVYARLLGNGAYEY
jgi:hypothetical protein